MRTRPMAAFNAIKLPLLFGLVLLSLSSAPVAQGQYDDDLDLDELLPLVEALMNDTCVMGVTQNLVEALTDPQFLQTLWDNNVNGTCQNVEGNEPIFIDQTSDVQYLSLANASNVLHQLCKPGGCKDAVDKSKIAEKIEDLYMKTIEENPCILDLVDSKVDYLYYYLAPSGYFDEFGVNKTTIEIIAEELLENLPNTVNETLSFLCQWNGDFYCGVGILADNVTDTVFTEAFTQYEQTNSTSEDDIEDIDECKLLSIISATEVDTFSFGCCMAGMLNIIETSSPTLFGVIFPELCVSCKDQNGSDYFPRSVCKADEDEDSQSAGTSHAVVATIVVSSILFVIVLVAAGAKYMKRGQIATTSKAKYSELT